MAQVGSFEGSFFLLFAAENDGRWGSEASAETQCVLGTKVTSMENTEYAKNRTALCGPAGQDILKL